MGIASRTLAKLGVPLMGLCGCLLVSFALHEPIPRTHDEFSYVLMGETFAQGHVANVSPPLPEFFDTFHVLSRPTYASKYFPLQGAFLALGSKLSGHLAFGIWVSSALASGALVWMLQAWIGPKWAFVGGLLFLLDYGVFSYWSQTFWGGMAAASGGAFVFGALHRLLERISWQNSFWFALGLVMLVNSRPLEGALASIPGIALLLRTYWGNGELIGQRFWFRFALPFASMFVLGALATGAYNRAITGSAFEFPYMLHEQQYQESPPFIFLPMRHPITYSSPMLAAYYQGNENRSYNMQHVPSKFVGAVARKLVTWWAFYCGVLLSIPLILPGVLKGGKIRWLQLALVATTFLNALSWSSGKVFSSSMLDLCALGQIALLWFVFTDKWSRLAIGTSALLLFELFFTKWTFPHYFAPAACLVLYLEVEGLRKIWAWNSQAVQIDRPLTRTERRRMARESESRKQPAWNLRWVVFAVPVACAISLIMRVGGRLNGSKDDPHGPDRQALLMNDWSLDRANIQKWLEQQPNPQLVFVRYSPYHNVNFEWVYNHPDIMHSHVIWARDLGPEHNKLLLNLLPDRTVWLLEADRKRRQLVAYNEAINSPTRPIPERTANPQPEPTD
jgi:hypothetical protein